MLFLFTLGLVLAALLALIVFAPDLWRWLARYLGARAPLGER